MYFKIKENKLFSVAVLLVAMIFILIPYNVKAMTPTQRQRCKVYSRIVGYYSSTDQWNPGKKSEWDERVTFSFPTDDNLNTNKSNK